MKKYMSIAVSTLVVSSFLMVGCSERQSDVPVNTPTTVVAKTNVVSVSVVDTDGKAVSGVEVALKGLATDVGGNAVTTLTTTPTGLVSFYSKVGEIVRVLTSKDGYVDSGSELNITKGANNKTVRIVKFDPNANVAGIEMEEANATASNSGKVTADLNITIADVNASPVTVITIPKDTVLKTEDGALITGKVKVEAVHYDDNSTESFPGGLVALASNVPDANGSGTTTEEVNFVSAGFTSITIKDEASGKTVKNFGDKNITIAMTLPHNTLNPETNVTVVAGDTIPIWSYDVSTGKWNYEALGTVIANPNDNNATWAVIYQASHLSYWNLDWHRSPVCKPAHINITDLLKGTDKITSLEIKGRGFNKTVFDYAGDGYYDLNNVPKTVPLTFSLKYDGADKNSTTVILNNTGCKVDLALGNVTPKTPTTVKFVEECSDGSHQKVLPSIPTYISSGGAWTYLGSGSKDGVLKFPVDNNTPAYIYAMASGNRYTESYIYMHVQAGSDNQTIKFVLGSQYDSYCFPGGDTGDTGAAGGSEL